jgi:CRP-like cAMP-binding protein
MEIKPSHLQKYSLFGGLLEEQIEKFLPLMEPASYEAGRDILVEGELNDKIWFILEGKVQVMKAGIHLSSMIEGDMFGEMEILDIMPSAATIRAVTAVNVVSISNKSLRDIYKIDIKSFALIIMNLARDCSRRLRAMDEKAVKTAEKPR